MLTLGQQGCPGLSDSGSRTVSTTDIGRSIHVWMVDPKVERSKLEFDKPPYPALPGCPLNQKGD